MQSATLCGVTCSVRYGSFGPPTTLVSGRLRHD